MCRHMYMTKQRKSRKSKNPKPRKTNKRKYIKKTQRIGGIGALASRSHISGLSSAYTPPPIYQPFVYQATRKSPLKTESEKQMDLIFNPDSSGSRGPPKHPKWKNIKGIYDDCKKRSKNNDSEQFEQGVRIVKEPLSDYMIGKAEQEYDNPLTPEEFIAQNSYTTKTPNTDNLFGFGEHFSK